MAVAATETGDEVVLLERVVVGGVRRDPRLGHRGIRHRVRRGRRRARVPRKDRPRCGRRPPRHRGPGLGGGVVVPHRAVRVGPVAARLRTGGRRVLDRVDRGGRARDAAVGGHHGRRGAGPRAAVPAGLAGGVAVASTRWRPSTTPLAIEAEARLADHGVLASPTGSAAFAGVLRALQDRAAGDESIPIGPTTRGACGDHRGRSHGGRAVVTSSTRRGRAGGGRPGGRWGGRLSHRDGLRAGSRCLEPRCRASRLRHQGPAGGPPGHRAPRVRGVSRQLGGRRARSGPSAGRSGVARTADPAAAPWPRCPGRGDRRSADASGCVCPTTRSRWRCWRRSTATRPRWRRAGRAVGQPVRPGQPHHRRPRASRPGRRGRSGARRRAVRGRRRVHHRRLHRSGARGAAPRRARARPSGRACSGPLPAVAATADGRGDGRRRGPGMLASHYAPAARVVLVEPGRELGERLAGRIRRAAAVARVAVLAPGSSTACPPM